MAATPKLLLVGDFPPPHGGVAVHVETVQRAVRSRGGQCTVLDIGKGQVPADGVVPAGGYASFTARLFGHALRGYRIHVHTSGANPKSWALAAMCAAAGKVSRVPSLITFHSGLGPAWLAEDPARARVACAVGHAFGRVGAGNGGIRRAVPTRGGAPPPIQSPGARRWRSAGWWSPPRWARGLRRRAWSRREIRARSPRRSARRARRAPCSGWRARASPAPTASIACWRCTDSTPARI